MRSPEIVSFLGQSGSGKTAQMGELIKDERFRVIPSSTTREARPTDLPNEYNHVDLETLLTAEKTERYIWIKPAGNGHLYARDICDMIEALTDEEHIYINALIPECAALLVQKYGAEVVRTVFLPSPPEDELIARMIRRGNTEAEALERIATEKAEDWPKQAAEIEGLYVVEGLTVPERHQEILSLVQF